MASNPKCPNCGSDMFIWKGKGFHEGKNFWLCKEYRRSCGSVFKDSSILITHKDPESSPPVSDDADAKPTGAKKIPKTVALNQIAVTWPNHVKRNAWKSYYDTIGSAPSYLLQILSKSEENVRRVISQTNFLIKNDHLREIETSNDAEFLSSILKKVLQRGEVPCVTLHTEKELVKKFNLEDKLEGVAYDAELGRSLDSSIVIDSISLIRNFFEKKRLVIDKEFDHVGLPNSLFDDIGEKDFLCNWITNSLGGLAPNWFIPQASLDTILRSYKDDRPFGDRRIDLLLCHPLAMPLAIEIDGPQHNSSRNVDKERDDALAQVGIDVKRIPTSAINTSPMLNEIQDYYNDANGKIPKVDKKLNGICDSLHESSLCSKLQFAILQGLENGWVKKDKVWNLEIEGMSSIGFFAVKDLLQMIIHLHRIYDIDYSPEKLVKVKIDNCLCSISADSNLIMTDISGEINDFKSDLKIRVESQESVLYEIVGENVGEDEPDSPDIIIRPTYLPVPLRIDSGFSQGRINKDKVKDNIDKESLRIFLSNIFRKKEFREQQAEGIVNILSHRDSVVLLPTGAGKSIIYQLAGMLMPGITVVVDPIVALIEDQVDVLQSHGISRAAPIRSARAEVQKDLLARAEKGEFYFMLLSPERLQSPRFRQTLSTLRNISLINLAVIDEAHCVSEWGHDFRPSYLNLSKNIREHMKDVHGGSPPPIIALTGTASRSVLKDVMTELELSKSQVPVLKPRSFDRDELKYWIRHCKLDQERESVAKAVFDELPKKFNIPNDVLYSPNGNKTYSGLVFGPHVNGDNGVCSNQNMVQSLTQCPTAIFSGKCPQGMNRGNWEDEKRSNAVNFKDNKVPILVATKAFGMGIDKPNIRYTIHLGMPSSLEGFYQEAGRAGRNRRESHCGIIFTEYDKKRTDDLLDETASFEQLKAKYEGVGRDYHDDVIRQLYFHVNNFPGIDEELEEIDKVLDSIGDLTQLDRTEIPRPQKDNDSKNIEKALHRLVRIGFVSDYQVDYGSAKFIVSSQAFDLDSSRKKLLDYIESAQPGTIKVYKKKLDAIKNTSNPKQAIILLSRNLIEFTYDVIEKGRRTALMEMVRLARAYNQDSDIRERILAYLTEGVSFEKIIKMLENKNINFPELFGLIEGTDRDNFLDLQGEARRNLESYADHPSLVLIMATTEAVISGNEETVMAHLLNIFSKEKSSSRIRYGLEEEQLYEILNWLLNFAQENSDILLRAIAFVYYKGLQNREFEESEKMKDFEEKLEQLNDRIVVMTKEIFNLESKSEELINYHKRAAKELDYDNIKSILGS